jgi:hypothetical protein
MLLGALLGWLKACLFEDLAGSMEAFFGCVRVGAYRAIGEWTSAGVKRPRPNSAAPCVDAQEGVHIVL